jgi:UTP--glucose-1-phosphate uridylyltransferase
VEYGLKHPELAEDFRAYLTGLTSDWNQPRMAKTGT